MSLTRSSEPGPDITRWQLRTKSPTSPQTQRFLIRHGHDDSHVLSSESNIVHSVYRSTLALSRRHHPYAQNGCRPFPLSSGAPALTSQDKGITTPRCFQTRLAGRKCWRTSKYKDEVVWPPHLEAALLEGLEQYAQPRVGLARFLNHSTFISRYILKNTGEYRTAKQVGCKIQQLRENSTDKQIMKEISDRHYKMMHPQGESSSMVAACVPTTSEGLMLSPGDQIVHVYITVPPEEVPMAPSLVEDSSPAPAKWTTLSESAYKWTEPRSLRDIDPTVTFRSSSSLPLLSTCSVYRGDTILHLDSPLVMAAREEGEHSFLHYTPLAPGYWDTLCSCTDLSSYTIIQEITRQSGDPSQRPTSLMVIQYHFSVIPHRPLSPFMVKDEDMTVSTMGDMTSLLEDTRSTCSDTPDLSDGSSSPTTSLPGWASQRHSPVSWPPRLPEPGLYDESEHKPAFELVNEKWQGLGRDEAHSRESQV
ncbi:hypothetical protein C8T65DRAFT_585694 [Cerioporus squamosus]|nr:hypothetical protein C8T65DRAFT_585694 [Cerioporus squamosus]